MLSGTKANIAIKLFGTDLNRMFSIGNSIKAAIGGVEGIADLNVEQQIDRPQLQIVPRREMLAKYGVPPAQFAEMVDVYLAGATVAQVYEGNRSFDLTVKVDDASRRTMDDIRNLTVDAAGAKIPFSEIAEIRSAAGPNTINRENVSRKIVISANVAGRDLQGVVDDIRRIVGEKITIVSHKPQTTRNRICAIVNRRDCQLVFVDTPGFHKPRTKLGDYMVNVVKRSISDVDAVILMVEPIANVGIQEKELIAQIKSADVPCILVINKIDTVEKESLLAVIAAYQEELDFEAVIPVSAKWHDGVAELLTECEKFAVEGPLFFPEDMVTDQPEKQVMAEIIREKLLWNLEREIPHGTAVEITKFSERDSGIIDIEATIYCEKPSHKGIIIGKNGQMLKKISTMARVDCEKFMGTKVYLQTWVKVKENWRDSQYLIGNFGYTNDD